MTEKEKKIFNYGVIVGTLETISRFNDKTNCGYDFELRLLPKLTTIAESIENIVIDISESYELEKIEVQDGIDLFFKLLHEKWFYSYQNKDEIHLLDLGEHFSLSDADWKKEWIEDFVAFLFKTLEPKNIYEINYSNLKSYYASDFDEFIFECENEVYYFKLAVSD